jgi:signal peptidase II
MKIVLTCITIGIAAVLGYMVHTRRSVPLLERVSFMLLFAGAVGNLIDRLLYGVLYGEGSLFEGKVVDFIQVDIPDVVVQGVQYTHWPVFNIADSCVSIGVVLMLVAAFRSSNNSAIPSQHEHA